MSVKVFNHTYGRDEEKVFGENTNRSFGCIEVPSVEEFSELSARFDLLQREHSNIRQRHEGLAATLKDQAAHMLDRQHADCVVAELKAAIADTTIFTQALYAALDEHDQRIISSHVQVRQEIAELQQKSHASEQAAQAHLQAIQDKSMTIAQGLKERQTEMKVMLTLAQLTQAEIKTRADEAASLKQWQDWSTQISRGGFLARLLWVLRGNPKKIPKT